MDSEWAPHILPKVIPVFVYNLMYTNYAVVIGHFIFLYIGLSRNYSIFHFFYGTEQI